jgi:hypothetical protein
MQSGGSLWAWQDKFENAERFLHVAWACCTGSRFGATSAGHVGVFSAHSQLGDVVAVFLGCRCPALLRPTGRAGHFRIIDVCYVHGIMDGELWADGVCKVELIRLV